MPTPRNMSDYFFLFYPQRPDLFHDLSVLVSWLIKTEQATKSSVRRLSLSTTKLDSTVARASPRLASKTGAIEPYGSFCRIRLDHEVCYSEIWFGEFLADRW